MSASLPEVHRLARALLDQEGVGEGADAALPAAERVLQRLAERISPLVGTGGFRMLLQRALRRAAGERAWLEAIELDRDTAWRLVGAEEAARDLPAEEAISTAETLVAELVGLVARFLGADLAIRLVRQSYPDGAVGGDTGEGSEETIHE
jgi:hypothetical protein